MENTTVILIAVTFAIVAARLIKKQKEKNQPGLGNQSGSIMNKGNKISSIPDDYEPYSGK
jgi:hypothetical protein